MHFAEFRRGRCPCGYGGLFAAGTASLYEGIALGTFGYCRIRLVCADLDTVKAAVILGFHVVLALRNGALDVGILLHLVHHHESFFL